MDLPQLFVAVGRRVVIGQPRQPNVGGRVALDQLVPNRVAVGGPDVGETTAHRRDRLPLQQLVEVLLARKQRQLAGCKVVLVEPA
jgi:hypothetical protein